MEHVHRNGQFVLQHHSADRAGGRGIWPPRQTSSTSHPASSQAKWLCHNTPVLAIWTFNFSGTSSSMVFSLWDSKPALQGQHQGVVCQLRCQYPLWSLIHILNLHFYSSSLLMAQESSYRWLRPLGPDRGRSPGRSLCLLASDRFSSTHCVH